jgi:non-lysosomal glucosylceramidase
MNNSKGFTYKDKFTREISFPLGGIGAGCIGLGGNGRLIDFEIFNKPNKNSFNGFTNIAVKVENQEKVLDARVLNGDVESSYMGESSMGQWGYGFGLNRSTFAGFPHFEEAVFTGAFPFAHIDFKDHQFPGEVRLTAFNPFIPLNDRDSSLPAAFFEIEFDNNTNQELTYTAAVSLSNPSSGKNVHSFNQDEHLSMIRFENTKYTEDSVEYGNMCLATDNVQTAAQTYWFRGAWFDSLGIFWKEFSSHGPIKQRNYTDVLEAQDTATLTGTVQIAPNSKGVIRFVISWYYPNCTNYWAPEKCDCVDTCSPKTWKNYYASLFQDASECAIYSLKSYKRLKSETELFRDTLFSSTLPESVMDAVSANISILKTPTCLRLTDGSFYGFEGCHCNGGCCEGSCTHVWNYAYALPFLFPALERSMRELDFKYNMDVDGGMAFRLQLPLGRERLSFRPCADGQFGGVIKVYREWKIFGDLEWLKSMWPYVKKNMEFAWSLNNQDKWDPDKTGVLHGRQHHTLDMELFGPNSWLTGFYLAALKACVEMGTYLDEEETANEYLELFKKGKAWVEANLFNGQYYFQKIDIKDKTIIDSFENAQNYWNEEAGEMKYQIGEGSAIDQILAQWHANICGLGEIFDNENVKKSLESIYQHNYKKSMRNHFNPCRLYCVNDESGTIICEWPDASKKPTIPLTYAEETMHGFEYQVAIHMIQEGMIEQGVELIKAVRDRYNGERRNPWNEIECGSNYARSMASYAALLSFSGFEFDMPNHRIGFNPVIKGNCRYFWSLDSGWGLFEKENEQVSILLHYGELKITCLNLPFITPKKIMLNGVDLAYNLKNKEIIFESPITILTGNQIEIIGDKA